MSRGYTSRLMLPMNSRFSSHASSNTAKGLMRPDQVAAAVAAAWLPYCCTACRPCKNKTKAAGHTVNSVSPTVKKHHVADCEAFPVVVRAASCLKFAATEDAVVG